MGGVGWGSSGPTFKYAGDPPGVPALCRGFPSSARWEPDVSKSPDATQGPVPGAPRPPRKTPSLEPFGVQVEMCSMSACRAGRRGHPRVALARTRGPGVAEAGWGPERRTRSPEPLGARSRRRAQRRARSAVPPSGRPGAGRLPAPRRCVGDPRPSAAAEADPLLRNLKSSPSGFSFWLCRLLAFRSRELAIAASL